MLFLSTIIRKTSIPLTRYYCCCRSITTTSKLMIQELRTVQILFSSLLLLLLLFLLFPSSGTSMVMAFQSSSSFAVRRTNLLLKYNRQSINQVIVSRTTGRWNHQQPLVYYHSSIETAANNNRSYSSSFPSNTRLHMSNIKEEINPGIVKGTSLRIVQYPHPSLRAKNEEISIDEIKNENKELSQLVKEMFLIMYAAQGVGLAAPQVGINKRLMVYNESGDSKKWLNEVVLINPKIIETSETTDIEIEGCLSFPNMNGKVERSKWIKVEALNLKGKKIKKKFVGWEARIFQHEYDHLDGIVYIDKLIDESKQDGTIQTRIQELIQEYGDGGAL